MCRVSFLLNVTLYCLLESIAYMLYFCKKYIFIYYLYENILYEYIILYILNAVCSLPDTNI